jgi:hypothetical protein
LPQPLEQQLGAAGIGAHFIAVGRAHVQEVDFGGLMRSCEIDAVAYDELGLFLVVDRSQNFDGW